MQKLEKNVTVFFMKTLHFIHKIPTWCVLTAIGTFTLSETIASTDTWTGALSSRLDLAGNWNPAEPTQPPAPGDQAVFGSGATSFLPALTDGSTFALYEALFTAPSSTYAFQINGASELTFGLLGDTHQNF